MISNAIVYPKNMSYTHMVVPCGCHKEQVTHQGHEVWALAGALLPDSYNGCIVAVEEYAPACPGVSPGGASRKYRIHFLSMQCLRQPVGVSSGC